MINKINIVSNINLNKLHIKKFIKLINLNINYNIISIDDFNLPPQMTNLSEEYLNYKITNLNKINYLLCIFNIQKIYDCKITDYFLIKFIDNINSKTYNISGSEVIIDYTILNTHSLFTNILSDFYNNYKETSHNYSFNGCKLKLSYFVNKYYPHIDEDKWIDIIFKQSKLQRVNTLLLKLSKIINNDI